MVEMGTYRVITEDPEVQRLLIKMRKRQRGSRDKLLIMENIERLEPFTIRYTISNVQVKNRIRPRQLIDLFNEEMIKRGFTPGADFKAEEVDQ